VSTKATHDLTLNKTVETRAFRAIEQVLKNDPILMRAVNKFVAWRGEDDDMYGVEKDITATICPFLKISPWPSQSAWITEGQHSMDFIVRIQVAVVGTKFDNLSNFWGAIRNAIFPQSSIAASNAVEAILRGPNQDQVTRPTITMSAYGVTADDVGARLLIADGTIKFGLLVNT
jgi:hypothetical protein